MSGHHLHQDTSDYKPIRLLWCLSCLAGFAALLWLIGAAWGVN